MWERCVITVLIAFLRCEITLGQSLQDLHQTLWQRQNWKCVQWMKIFNRSKGQILTRSRPFTLEYDIMIPHYTSVQKVPKELHRGRRRGWLGQVSGTSFCPNFLLLAQFNLALCHFGSADLCERQRSEVQTRGEKCDSDKLMEARGILKCQEVGRAGVMIANTCAEQELFREVTKKLGFRENRERKSGFAASDLISGLSLVPPVISGTVQKWCPLQSENP